MGRPSVDPVLRLRTLLIGHPFAPHPDRTLRRRVTVNPACRWSRGLSIEDKIPDDSASCRHRSERFRGSDLFRRAFERVVENCMSAGPFA